MQQLNKKKIKELEQKTNQTFCKKDKIILDNNVIFVNNTPYFLIDNNKYLPLLKNPIINNLKSIYIDMQAVPFIAKGADVMRPGITKLDDFEKDEVIAIKDEKHNKILALGIALYDSKTIKSLEKGKVIKTYNFVGDKYWSLNK